MFGEALYILGVLGCMALILAVVWFVIFGFTRLWRDLRYNEHSLAGTLTGFGVCGLIVFIFWVLQSLPN